MKIEHEKVDISDLSKNSFVKMLNTEGKSPDYGALVFPTDKELERVAKKGKETLRESTKKTRMLIEQLGHPVDIQGTIEEVRKRQTKLKAELKDAFAMERPAIQESLSAVESQLATLSKSFRRISRGQSLGARTSGAANTLREKFDVLLKNFPGAQLLDLSAITSFKNQQGLPAVALFSLDSPKAKISLGRESWETGMQSGASTGILSAMEHSIFFEKLRNLIAVASGVYCGGKDVERNKDLVAQLKLVYPKDWKEQLPRLTAEVIQLETEFPKSKGIFPKEARELIRKAKASGKFRDIFLLAEVDKWELGYGDLRGVGIPKLKGEIILRPKSKDPLIVAPANIGKREYWFVLGAFDTTPVEEVIRREFSTNPNV